MLESQFVRKLQEKPEPQKLIIMWAAALAIMILIFSFWLWNFSSQIPKTANSGDDSQKSSDSLQQLPGVWQSFKSQFDNLTQLFSK